MIGSLATDPVARTTNSGKSQSSFRIAVTRRFANQQGVRETDFFQVLVFGKTAEFCNNYLTKGAKVAVEGNVQNRSYEKDGAKHWVTEIYADSVEALKWRENAEGNNSDAPKAAPSTLADEGFTEVDGDGELPF